MRRFVGFLSLLVTQITFAQNNNLGTGSAIPAGTGNTTTAGTFYNFIGGGGYNTNRANNSFIGAGVNNDVQQARSAVLVGTANTNRGNSSAIICGLSNSIAANTFYNFIGGGAYHTNNANNAFIGAGVYQTVNGVRSAIVGGWDNTVNAYDSFIGSGSYNSISTLSDGSIIGGGISNTVTARSPYAVICGGFDNQIYNGTTNSLSNNFIGGGWYNTVSEGGPSAVIVGGDENAIQGLSRGAFLGGGRQNLITGSNCNDTVLVGGQGNEIVGDDSSCSGSVLVGGNTNRITNAVLAVISGGVSNTVQASYGTIGGGQGNTVINNYGTIPGGYENIAGYGCVALGYRARATNINSFVLNLSLSAVGSTAGSQATIAAPGGTRILSSADGTLGVILSNNATSWASLSDRNSKENFRAIQPKLVLQKLGELPVTEWNYKHNPGRKYIGPTSQDFQASFGLGADTTIETLDSDGVMFAAIQGLVQELAERDRAAAWRELQHASALAERDGEMEGLRQEMRALKARVDSLAPPGR